MASVALHVQGRWALLIGQLLHMQGHGTRIVAKLVVLWDIHVTFCVSCVIGHPDCDWGTCDGHLRATVDGWGREREKEKRDTRTWVSSQAPALGRLSRGLPRGHEEQACTRGLAGRGPQTVCPHGLCAVEGGQVSSMGVFRPGSAPPWSHCLPASSSSSPPRGARTVLPAWGPLPRRSSHHAPPLPIRGRGSQAQPPTESCWRGFVQPDAVLGSAVAGNEEGGSAPWGCCGEKQPRGKAPAEVPPLGGRAPRGTGRRQQRGEQGWGQDPP